MRRVLLGTPLGAVLTTLLLVPAVLAVLLAWPGTPGGSVLPQRIAPDAALAPAALVAVLVAVLLAGVLAQSGGFFLHLTVGASGRGSVGTRLTRTGALLIAVALVILAIGIGQA